MLADEFEFLLYVKNMRKKLLQLSLAIILVPVGIAGASTGGFDGGGIFGDRPFWGEDCVSVGVNCSETGCEDEIECCTRYRFWIATSTSC